MTDTGIRWFVLPPSQEYETWRSILLRHATERGAPIVEVLTGNEKVPPGSAALTSDIDIGRLAGAQASDTIVVRLKPFVDLTDCSEAERPFRVLDITRKIAAAYSFEGLTVSDGETLPHPFIDLPPLDFRPRRATALEEDFSGALNFISHGTAKWPPTIFRYATREDIPHEPGHVDITGRPRLIVYGPYIFLTPGVWRTTVRLAFDSDAAQKSYQIQWGGSESYASHDFSPGHGGVFEVELEHEWTTHGASEVRLMLMEGAFHGQLRFHGATIQKIG